MATTRKAATVALLFTLASSALSTPGTHPATAPSEMHLPRREENHTPPQQVTKGAAQ